jgi:UDP-N-acetylenolpyruvoylglucosamine reductase
MNRVVTDICFTFPKKAISKEKLEKAKIHRKKIPYPSAGGIFVNWHELKPYQDKLIGLTEGGMKVSDMVNIIHNYGNGTYVDIMTLIYKIEDIVKKPLELEVKIL